MNMCYSFTLYLQIPDLQPWAEAVVPDGTGSVGHCMMDTGSQCLAFIMKHRWAWVHVSVFICLCPANLHWSDLSNSLGDSISTVTRFWLELEGLWYRLWTGTVASCFPERKTSAVKPEDRYSGASRSTFESRRTYKTCSSSSQLKWKVNQYSYAKHLAWYGNRSPPNRCLVLEFPADIHPCKLHLAASGPVKLSHHDLVFPTEPCIGDPYKPNII